MGVFDILLQTVNSVLYFYLNYLFFSTFLKRKCGGAVFTVVFIIVTVLGCADLIFFSGTLWVTAILVVLNLVLIFTFESTLIQKVIYIFLIAVMHCIGEFVVGFSTQLIFGVTIEQNRTGVYFVVGMLLSKLLIYILIMFVRINKHSVMVPNAKKNFWGVLLFPVSSIFILCMFPLIFQEYNESPADHIIYLILLAGALLGFANIIVFDFIDSIYKNTLNEGKVAAANEIIINQRAQYQSLIDHNREIVKLQHDNKNYFIGLMAQLKEGRVDDALESLSHAYDISIADMNLSGNIVNILFNVKKQKANEDGIELILDAHSLNDILVQPVDMAIILGNALDNAIEACKLSCGKTVELFVTVKNGSVILIIQNPVNNDVDVNNLITKKPSPEQHGFGIISMKQLAEKYNGEVIFSVDKSVFKATVMLKNMPLDNE